MSIRTLGRCRVPSWIALGAFALFVLPVASLAKGTSEGASGALSGFIYAQDSKTPVTGAVVKVRNLSDLKELTSPPTDANGMYTITGIPEGRYLLGITSARTDFNLDYSLYVKAGELGKLSVSLASGGGAGQESGSSAPKKKGFFRSVAGRVLVVAAVGVGLYFLLADNEESSPIR